MRQRVYCLRMASRTNLGIAIDITLDNGEATAVAELRDGTLVLTWQDGDEHHIATVDWEDFRALARLLELQDRELVA
jgi:hypothetical protein